MTPTCRPTHYLLQSGFLLLFCAMAAVVHAMDLERQVTLEIAAQPLSSAVIEFGRQAGVQIVTQGSDLTTLSSPGVSGTHSLQQALQLLLSGTGMDYKVVGEMTLVLIASPVAVIPLREELAPPVVQEAAVNLETITVSAGKRDQSLAEVAGSVAAISGDTLEKMGAQSFEDYLKLVPGVTMNRSGTDKSAPIIRGIASDTLPGIGSRTTGIFVDEIPLNDLFLTTANIDMNPFDLERVEVLKGPQGTLFGSSAIAGAIRYITNKPEPGVWLVRAHGSYTSIAYGQRKPLGAAMLNVPLGGTAALRAVGLVRKSPGYIDDINRGIPDVGSVEQETARVMGSWQPLDGLKLLGTWLKQDSYAADDDFADQTERLERSSTNGPNTRDSHFSIGNLVASYDFDWGAVLSNTSQVTKDNFSVVNADRGLPGQGEMGPEDQPTPVFNGYGEAATKGLVQELRVSSPLDSGSWNWLAGLAYLRFNSFNTSNNSGPLEIPNATLLPVAIPGIALDDATSLSHTEFFAVARERAVFAEASRRFWDRWELTLGGRFFKTDLVADTLINGASQALNGQQEARSHIEMEDKGFNPKFALRFELTPDIGLYALVARGFQFGGVQLTPPSRTNDTLIELEGGPGFKPYDSSILWNYELGIRSLWWGNRLQVDATVFDMDWRDLQLAQLVYAQGRPITVVYTNVGKAHSRGGELTLRLSLFDHLNLSSSAAYVDAATDVPLETSDGTYPVGTRLPGSARVQTSNSIAYQQPFSFLGNWTASASATHSYTDIIFNDLAHSAQFGDYETVDCAVRLVNEDLRWQPDLSFTLSNALDERGVSGIATCNGCRFKDVFFVRPRTGLLSLTVRF